MMSNCSALTRKLSWLLSSLLVVVATASAQLVIRDTTRPLYKRQVVHVPRPLFKESRLADLCREMVELNKERTFIMIYFVPDRDEPAEVDYVHRGYGYWKSVYDRVRHKRGLAGECIAIQDSVGLRYRDRQGNVHRVVLRGSDPLAFTISGSRCEILHFSFRSVPEPLQKRWGQDERLVVYMKTDGPLSEELGRQTFETLEKWLPIRKISVRIRRDVWFTQAGFPLVFHYRTKLHPPSWEQHRQTKTLYCGRDWRKENFRCNLYTPRY